jgi:putative membrane protein
VTARDPAAGSRLRFGILAGSAAVFAAGAIEPKYPSDWLLEHLVTFAAVAAVAAAWRRFVFSNLSLALVALLLALHTYGAHYTYSETPLGDWLRDRFGLARNPYDRVVHFAFGLLATYPWREICLRELHLHRLGSWRIPVLASTTVSASYELVESWAARIVAPELGTAFLGTQGDEWDAQKDMAAALAGSLLCLAGVALFRALTGCEPWRALAGPPREGR